MVALQERLIATPAVGPDNAGPGEWAKAQLVKDCIAPWVDAITECHAPDSRVAGGVRPNFFATMRGARHDRCVWFLVHLDVVSPGNASAWNTPPFQAVVKDGKIFGRGAEDNHQGLCSSLFAAKAFREAGITPPCDIGLAIVSDEETGSAYGLEYALKHHNPFRPSDIVIVPDGGPPSGDQLEIAEKGGMWVKFTVEGKTAHASLPEFGINAQRVAGHLLVALDALYTRFPERSDVFAPPTSTFEPTTSYGNDVSVNVVPGTASFVFDCRLLPNVKSDQVLRTMRELAQPVEQRFGARVAIDVIRQTESAPATPPDSAVVRLLSSAVQAINQVPPRLIGFGGGTIAKFVRSLGVPAVVYSKTEEVLHTANEYCVIDNMVSDAKVLAHVAFHAGDGL